MVSSECKDGGSRCYQERRYLSSWQPMDKRDLLDTDFGSPFIPLSKRTNSRRNHRRQYEPDTMRPINNRHVNNESKRKDKTVQDPEELNIASTHSMPRLLEQGDSPGFGGGPITRVGLAASAGNMTALTISPYQNKNGNSTSLPNVKDPQIGASNHSGVIIAAIVTSVFILLGVLLFVCVLRHRKKQTGDVEVNGNNRTRLGGDEKDHIILGGAAIRSKISQIKSIDNGNYSENEKALPFPPQSNTAEESHQFPMHDFYANDIDEPLPCYLPRSIPDHRLSVSPTEIVSITIDPYSGASTLNQSMQRVSQNEKGDSSEIVIVDSGRETKRTSSAPLVSAYYVGDDSNIRRYASMSRHSNRDSTAYNDVIASYFAEPRSPK